MKELFENYVRSYVPNGKELLKKIDWNKWLFLPGMPDDTYLNFLNKEINDTLKLVNCYKNRPVCNKSIYNNFMLDQKIIFVQRIRDLIANFSKEIIVKMENELVISLEKNPEISAVWLEIAALKNIVEVRDTTEEFLKNYGRMKYILPIYAGLAKSDKGYAIKVFEKLKRYYHPIAIEQIKKLIA